MKRIQSGVLLRITSTFASLLLMHYIAFAEDSSDTSTSTVIIPSNAEYERLPGASGTFTGISRSQQIYEGSQFPRGTIMITELRWRPSVPYGTNFCVTFSNIVIRLSGTTAKVGALSTTFSENIGHDEEVVYKGPLTVSASSAGLPNRSKDTEIIVTLQRAFRFNPGLAKSLLLDITVFDSPEGAALVQVEAAGKIDEAHSRIVALDTDATAADFSDIGLDKVKFIYQKLP